MIFVPIRIPPPIIYMIYIIYNLVMTAATLMLATGIVEVIFYIIFSCKHKDLVLFFQWSGLQLNQVFPGLWKPKDMISV